MLIDYTLHVRTCNVRSRQTHIQRTGTRFVLCRTTVQRMAPFTARVGSDSVTVLKQYFTQSVFKQNDL
jgi:hypothetical protein